MDAHELVVALKRLAAELGRTPSRAEFESSVRGGRYNLRRAFGGYVALCQAAGLETLTTAHRPKTVFAQKDIGQRMDEYHADPNRPKASEPEVPITESILAIGDTHFPFEHRPALEWAISQAEQLKPSIIVQCGDLYDMFAWSRFPKSLVYTPQQERDLARERAELFWKQMQAASPKAKCYQIIGNHDIRPFRQMLGSAPALEVFLNLTPFFEFPGVTTIHDERQELVLQGVHFIHGYKSQMGAHRDHMVANAVVGHTHLGGTSFRSIRGRILWELNAGFLGDPDSKAMSYTPQKITKYTLGLGLIDARGPRFIPYPSKD